MRWPGERERLGDPSPWQVLGERGLRFAQPGVAPGKGRPSCSHRAACAAHASALRCRRARASASSSHSSTSRSVSSGAESERPGIRRDHRAARGGAVSCAAGHRLALGGIVARRRARGRRARPRLGARARAAESGTSGTLSDVGASRSTICRSSFGMRRARGRARGCAGMLSTSSSTRVVLRAHDARPIRGGRVAPSSSPRSAWSSAERAEHKPGGPVSGRPVSAASSSTAARLVPAAEAVESQTGLGRQEAMRRCRSAAATAPTPRARDRRLRPGGPRRRALWLRLMYARRSSSSAPSSLCELHCQRRASRFRRSRRAEYRQHRAERVQRVALDLGGPDLAGDADCLLARRACLQRLALAASGCAPRRRGCWLARPLAPRAAAPPPHGTPRAPRAGRSPPAGTGQAARARVLRPPARARRRSASSALRVSVTARWLWPERYAASAARPSSSTSVSCHRVAARGATPSHSSTACSKCALASANDHTCSASIPASTDAASAVRQLVRRRPVHGALRRSAVRTDGKPWITLQRSRERGVQRDALAGQQLFVQGLAQELVPKRVALARRILHQHVVLDRLPECLRQLVLAPSPTSPPAVDAPTIEPATAAERTTWRACGESRSTRSVSTSRRLSGIWLARHSRPTRPAAPRRRTRCPESGQTAPRPARDRAARSRIAASCSSELAAAERRQLQPLDHRQPLDLGQELPQRMAAVKLVGAVGRDQQQPLPARCCAPGTTETRAWTDRPNAGPRSRARPDASSPIRAEQVQQRLEQPRLRQRIDHLAAGAGALQLGQQSPKLATPSADQLLAEPAAPSRARASAAPPAAVRTAAPSHPYRHSHRRETAPRSPVPAVRTRTTRRVLPTPASPPMKTAPASPAPARASAPPPALQLFAPADERRT